MLISVPKRVAVARKHLPGSFLRVRYTNGFYSPFTCITKSPKCISLENNKVYTNVIILYSYVINHLQVLLISCLNLADIKDKYCGKTSYHAMLKCIVYSSLFIMVITVPLIS